MNIFLRKLRTLERRPVPTTTDMVHLYSPSTGKDHYVLLNDLIAGGGYPDWSSGTTYAINNTVTYGLRLWKSLQNANTGNTPSENTWWTEISATPVGTSLSQVLLVGNTSGPKSILFDTTYGIDSVATGGSDVLNIGTNNADVINIGRSGATVNIAGNVLYENVTNLQVTDKLITLNKGGAVSSATGSGIEFEENAVITGYIKTNAGRDGYEMKAPGIASKATFSLASLTADRIYTLPDLAGTFALTSQLGASGWPLTGTGTLTGAVSMVQAGFSTTFSGIGTVTFSPTSTQSGLNVGQLAGNPATTRVNGDLWYNSSLNYFGIWYNGGLGVLADVGSVSTNQIPRVTGTGVLSGTTQLTYFTATGGANSGLQVANRIVISQPALSSTWASAFVVTPGAHTTMTGGTEFINNDFSGATQTWLAGTVTLQRGSYFRGFTVVGTSATAIFTDIATIYADKSVVGTNASISRNWAIVSRGNMFVGEGQFYGTYSGAGIFRNTLAISSDNGDGYAIILMGNSTGSGVHMRNPNGNDQFNIRGGLSGIDWLSTDNNHNIILLTKAAVSGSPTALKITPGSHTTLTAAEVIDIDFNMARTVQFTGSTGFATQRGTFFRGTTYAFQSATGTISNTYTVYIGVPNQGTNAALTAVWSLGVEGNIEMGNSGTSGSSRLIAANGTGNVDLTLQNKGTAAFNFSTTTGSAIIQPGGSATALVLRGVGTTPTIVLATSATNSGLNITSVTASSGDIEIMPSAAATYFLKIKGSNPSSSAGGPVSLLGGSPAAGNNVGGDATIASGIPSGSGAEGSVFIQNRPAGKISFFNVTAVIQQSVNAILVNNVTSGGTLSTIADVTDITTYSNAGAGAAIRNNFFRLAEKVLKLETALRNYGLAVN